MSDESKDEPTPEVEKTEEKSAETSAAEPNAKPGIMRRMYDWTLSWADRKEGAWALFLIAFAESSFFPIPPDVLLLALCVGAVTKSFKFAAICTAGSVIGGAAGYGIGFYGWEAVGQPIVEMYNGQRHLDKIQKLVDQYGFLGILIAAITPIPYKVFTIAAGLFKYNFALFMIASVIGRGFRFFVVAAILYRCGPKVKELIDKYFNLFAWLFMVVLILGFLALKFLKH